MSPIAFLATKGPSKVAGNTTNFVRSALRAISVVAVLLCGLSAQAQPEDIDPLEGVNRDIFAFNTVVDKYVFKPVARAYSWVLPDVAERGVGRFFDNLEEVGSAVNNLAQGKGSAAVTNAGRFLVNSTAGILGFMDVADKIGLEKEDFEDFGQTLAVWGVGSGPYLMMPLIGPTTLRDGPGFIVDSNFSPQSYLEDVGARNAARTLDIVSLRAKYIDADQALPEKDPYSFVRDAYLQRRDYLIQDGQIADDFGADGSDDFLD